MLQRLFVSLFRLIANTFFAMAKPDLLPDRPDVVERFIHDDA